MSKIRGWLVVALVAVIGPARAEEAAGPTSDDRGAGGATSRDLLPPDGIDWATAQALQAAAAEATRRNVSPESCRIHVSQWGDHLIVLFDDGRRPAGWKGCPPGPCRCFEVGVTRDGGRVLRAAFSR